MRNALRLLPVAVLLGLATTASASGPATFAEAKELATAQEKPLLVDFFATWCGPCKAFAKAVETDGDVQGALADVVLFTTDAEKGEGLDLAKLHKVQGYPTFVLATAQGEPMDTWSGYGKEYFLDHLREALADPTTVEQKRARFAGSPTPGDAEKLARYYSTTGENERAVELYRQASELGAPSDFAYEIFEAMVYGYSKQDLFSPEEIRKAADRVVAGKDRDADALVQTYYLMQRVEKKAQAGDVATPYLVPAMKAIEGSEEYAGTLANLKVEHALRVEKDPEAAFEAKIAAQPEGWKDNPGRLNSVAWWCFENHVRLDEAQALAERGVKLAPPGDDRASILDTLAEICNARGNCPEAVTWIRQAVQEAPEKEYYRKQLERFEALAAEMN